MLMRSFCAVLPAHLETGPAEGRTERVARVQHAAGDPPSHLPWHYPSLAPTRE